MNSKKEKTVLALLITGFIIVLGLAGREDYNQAVMASMDEAVYMAISEKLGMGCSNEDIVEEYKSNRTYYDSLTYNY